MCISRRDNLPSFRLDSMTARVIDDPAKIDECTQAVRHTLVLVWTNYGLRRGTGRDKARCRHTEEASIFDRHKQLVDQFIHHPERPILKTYRALSLAVLRLAVSCLTACLLACLRACVLASFPFFAPFPCFLSFPCLLASFSNSKLLPPSLPPSLPLATM